MVKLAPITVDASVTMAVYLQAMDANTKAISTFCFMYRGAAATDDFCCPKDFNKTGCLTCAQSRFTPLNADGAVTVAIWGATTGCAKCDNINGFTPYLFAKTTGGIVRGC
jgi:hypothetical protein